METTINIAEPSVMSLFIEMKSNGQLLATGTAFLALAKGKPVLVTNRHNVTGRHQDTGQPLSKSGGIPNEIAVLHNKLNHLGQWIIKSEPLYDGDQHRWIEHPTLRQNADFVALPLTQLDDVHLYPYDPAKPGPEIRVGPADIVSVIGFPFGMNAGGALGVWATGFMASEPEIDFDQLPIFLIDYRTRQGQSGSAVIAYRSSGAVGMIDGGTAMYSGPIFRFLGIYSGRINPQSDLGIVWKASALSELLQSSS
jgi:hypothetical protein